MPISLAALVPHPPILLPAVGRGREHDAQHTLDAYTLLNERVQQDPPDRLLLITTHGIVTLRRFHMLAAPLSCTLEPFGAPDCRIDQPDDPALAAAICHAAAGLPLSVVGHWEPHDHSSAVPLLLLQRALANVPTTVINVCFRSTADHHQLGQTIAAAIEATPGTTALIASGDGAHTLTDQSPHGHHPQAAGFQQQLNDAIRDWDVEELLGFDEDLRREIDESVVAPMALLTGILHRQQIIPQLLAAESPWGVGYTTALLEIAPAK